MHDRAVKAMSALAGGAVSYFLLPWLHDPLAEAVPWLNRNGKRIGDLQLLWLNRSHIDCTFSKSKVCDLGHDIFPASGPCHCADPVRMESRSRPDCLLASVPGFAAVAETISLCPYRSVKPCATGQVVSQGAKEPTALPERSRVVTIVQGISKQCEDVCDHSNQRYAMADSKVGRDLRPASGPSET